MSPTTRRWVRRAVTSGVTAAVVLVAAMVLDYDPEPLRVVLLCLLAIAGTWLLTGELLRTDPVWYPVPTHQPLHEGRDTDTQGYLRILENHQLSRHPDTLLRDRLAVLAEQVLAVRHGVHVHSERGRALLGPDLVAVLDGPVQRLAPRHIDRLLRQIEEL